MIQGVTFLHFHILQALLFLSAVAILCFPWNYLPLSSATRSLYIPSIPSFYLIHFIRIYLSFALCLGLVATIKEHITQPTAMAQGRVAHLIEWKGWGGSGEARGRGGGWSGACRKGGAWGGMGAELQEDEQFYSQMTDEIKEARFAAGETDAWI